MKAIVTEISGVDVLIQAEDDIEIINGYGAIEGDGADHLGIQGIRGDTFKNLGDKLNKLGENSSKAFESVSKVISAFSNDCKKELDKYDTSPNEVEIEFSLSIKGETSVLLAKGEAKADIKVKMKWEKNKPTQQGGSI